MQAKKKLIRSSKKTSAGNGHATIKPSLHVYDYCMSNTFMLLLIYCDIIIYVLYAYAASCSHAL